jgi:hypothetical protein
MLLTPHNLTYHDHFYKHIILNSVPSYVEQIVSAALLKMNMHPYFANMNFKLYVSQYLLKGKLTKTGKTIQLAIIVGLLINLTLMR